VSISPNLCCLITLQMTRTHPASSGVWLDSFVCISSSLIARKSSGYLVHIPKKKEKTNETFTWLGPKAPDDNLGVSFGRPTILALVRQRDRNFYRTARALRHHSTPPHRTRILRRMLLPPRPLLPLQRRLRFLFPLLLPPPRRQLPYFLLRRESACSLF
jgi:hypothetical protein